MQPIDVLLDSYSADHQNLVNQRIHVVCVPAIVWSVTAMLWTVPVPTALLRPGAVAGLAMFGTWIYYWKQSRSLAVGWLMGFLLFGLINDWLAVRFGMRGLLQIAVGVFVLAWIGQFIGHIKEGKRPSFFTDLVYLLIGPLWTLRKLYLRLGIKP